MYERILYSAYIQNTNPEQFPYVVGSTTIPYGSRELIDFYDSVVLRQAWSLKLKNELQFYSNASGDDLAPSPTPSQLEGKFVLDDLDDVAVDNATSGEILVFDGNEWKPDSVSGGGGSGGTGFDYDNSISPSEGQILQYQSGKWKPSNLLNEFVITHHEDFLDPSSIGPESNVIWHSEDGGYVEGLVPGYSKINVNEAEHFDYDLSETVVVSSAVDSGFPAGVNTAKISTQSNNTGVLETKLLSLPDTTSITGSVTTQFIYSTTREDGFSIPKDVSSSVTFSKAPLKNVQGVEIEPNTNAPDSFQINNLSITSLAFFTSIVVDLGYQSPNNGVWYFAQVNGNSATAAPAYTPNTGSTTNSSRLIWWKEGSSLGHYVQVHSKFPDSTALNVDNVSGFSHRKELHASYVKGSGGKFTLFINMHPAHNTVTAIAIVGVFGGNFTVYQCGPAGATGASAVSEFAGTSNSNDGVFDCVTLPVNNTFYLLYLRDVAGFEYSRMRFARFSFNEAGESPVLYEEDKDVIAFSSVSTNTFRLSITEPYEISSVTTVGFVACSRGSSQAQWVRCGELKFEGNDVNVRLLPLSNHSSHGNAEIVYDQKTNKNYVLFSPHVATGAATSLSIVPFEKNFSTLTPGTITLLNDAIQQSTYKMGLMLNDVMGGMGGNVLRVFSLFVPHLTVTEITLPQTGSCTFNSKTTIPWFTSTNPNNLNLHVTDIRASKNNLLPADEKYYKDFDAFFTVSGTNIFGHKCSLIKVGNISNQIDFQILNETGVLLKNGILTSVDGQDGYQTTTVTYNVTSATSALKYKFVLQRLGIKKKGDPQSSPELYQITTSTQVSSQLRISYYFSKTLFNGRNVNQITLTSLQELKSSNNSISWFVSNNGGTDWDPLELGTSQPLSYGGDIRIKADIVKATSNTVAPIIKSYTVTGSSLANMTDIRALQKMILMTNLKLSAQMGINKYELKNAVIDSFHDIGGQKGISAESDYSTPPFTAPDISDLMYTMILVECFSGNLSDLSFQVRKGDGEFVNIAHGEIFTLGTATSNKNQIQFKITNTGSSSVSLAGLAFLYA